MDDNSTTKKDLIRISDDQHEAPSKPKQEILDEDSYTEALSEIIKRDFFPSLLTLEAQNDYVDAWNTNNPELIKEATRKLTELTTPTLKTPGMILVNFLILSSKFHFTVNHNDNS
jgi:hypothetical protein